MRCGYTILERMRTARVLSDVAAKGAGVPVVAVSFGYSPEPVETFSPDAVIDSYDDLETALVRVSPAFRACLAERS